MRGHDALKPSFHLRPGGASLSDLGTAAGAYLLLVELPEPLALTLAGKQCVLTPGRHAYCGSAYGPGGLAARLARHLRADKRPHWHIDRLTAAGSIAAVYAQPEGRECDLVAALRRLPGTTIPLPGFGSSDCRTCPAHLVKVPADENLAKLPGLCRVLPSRKGAG